MSRLINTQHMWGGAKVLSFSLLISIQKSMKHFTQKEEGIEFIPVYNQLTRLKNLMPNLIMMEGYYALTLFFIQGLL